MAVPNVQSMAIQTNILTDLASNITHIAVGSDDTTPTEADTTLGSEDYREAKYDSIQLSSSLVVSIFMDTTENNGNTMNEVGTFNQASGGTLYSKNLVTTSTKTALKNQYYFIRFNFSFSTSSITT